MEKKEVIAGDKKYIHLIADEGEIFVSKDGLVIKEEVILGRFDSEENYVEVSKESLEQI